MTRRDPVTHRAPVLPLHPSSAGGPTPQMPTVVSITDVWGRRISTVRRGDGSAFTVTVPPGGIDAPPEAGSERVSWIREHGGRRQVPAGALDSLAARVGLRLVAGPSFR